jgi:phosphoheptose isomerase
MDILDLTEVTTYPLAQRSNLVHLADLLMPDAPVPAFESEALSQVAARIVRARREGHAVVWMMGAHVIKSGLSRLVIDLMARGLITHIAGNGAVSIHDVELALIGETSEDVATRIEDGSFGMVDETGRWMHRALREGARDGWGYGAAIGRLMDRHPEHFPHRDVSVLWQAYRLGIPATIHVTIGTDIIHQHPNADFAVLGATSGRDFLHFVTSVSGLEGGVFLNFGSAVTGPEVFLKALTIARNLGYTVSHITTANFDLVSLGDDIHGRLGYGDPLYYYRPKKNIVNRPTSLGGAGYHITGDHRMTIPNLRHRVVAELACAPRLTDECQPESPLPGAAGAILADLIARHPELSGVEVDIARVFRELVHCFGRGGTLFLCGNGGSMADALHISGELLKSYAHARTPPEGLRRRLAEMEDGELLLRNLEGGLRTVVLGTNPSLASAVANDRPDRDVNLAQELLALGRPGDVLLGISTGGNARNIAYAVQVARAAGLTALGLTGSGGGRLAELADIAVRVPALRTDRIQELHVLCYHALCEMLEVTLFGPAGDALSSHSRPCVP